MEISYRERERCRSRDKHKFADNTEIHYLNWLKTKHKPEKNQPCPPHPKHNQQQKETQTKNIKKEGAAGGAHLTQGPTTTMALKISTKPALI